MSKFMESAQEHHNPEWVLLSNLQQEHQMLQLQYNTVPQSTVKSKIHIIERLEIRIKPIVKKLLFRRSWTKTFLKK